jgi:hypothetical protein
MSEWTIEIIIYDDKTGDAYMNILAADDNTVICSLGDDWKLARLLRAAPDLLEACRMFVDAHTDEALDLAHSKAQAVIAQVDGEPGGCDE